MSDRSHLGQILGPLTEYPSVRFRACWLAPSIAALLGVAAGAAFWRFSALNIAGERGLVDATLPLLSLLVGFYVAALGLAATLTDEFLDQVPENPPHLHGEEITWRRFLCSLFGFLVVNSLLAHLLGVATWIGVPYTETVSLSIAAHCNLQAASVTAALRGALGATYCGLLMNLVLHTFLGIYLLSTRYIEEREAANVKRVGQSKCTCAGSTQPASPPAAGHP